MKNGWIKLTKTPTGQILERKVDKIEDTVRAQLQQIKDGNYATLSSKDLDNLKRRNLISQGYASIKKLGFRDPILTLYMVV